MVEIIDGKIVYDDYEISMLWAAPGSNASKQIKRKVRRLKEQLKK